MNVIGRLLPRTQGAISGFRPSHFFLRPSKWPERTKKKVKFRDVKYLCVRWSLQGARYCQTTNILLDFVRGGDLSMGK